MLGGFGRRGGRGGRRGRAVGAAGVALAVRGLELPLGVRLVLGLHVGGRELLAVDAGEDLVAEASEDRLRQVRCAHGRAVALDGFARVVAGPHRDRDLRGIAAEPEIVGLLGGAGLAGNRLVHREPRGRRRTARDDTGEYLVHGLRILCGKRLRGAVLVLVERLAGARGDLGDGDGVALLAAGGKGGICAGHLERRYGARAERHGRGVEEVDVLEADGLGGLDDLVVADRIRHLHVAGVRRYLGRAFERDVAVVVVAEILNFPRTAHLDRRGAVERDVGVHALADGRGQRDGLERRTRLTLGRGVVDVVGIGVVVAAADHGLDVARLGVDGDDARLQVGEADLVQGGRHGVFGGALVGGVDRGLDGEAALEDHVGRELLAEELAHVVDEVGLRVHLDARARGFGDVQHDVLGLGRVVLLLGDVPQAQHVVENLVAARFTEIGILRGVVERGGVRQTDEHGGFGERDIFGALGEIGLRGRLDAIGAVAVVDGVEIHVEDLVLGVDLLHLDGDIGLANLALDGLGELLVGEDRVAHELLGDGRCALMAARERCHGRARDAVEVDAAVLVVTLVLDVDGPLQDIGADLARLDRLAVLRVERCDLVAVGIEDVRRLRDKVLVGVRVVGQVLQPSVHVADHAHAESYAGYEHEGEKREDDDGNGMRLCAAATLAFARTHG